MLLLLPTVASAWPLPDPETDDAPAARLGQVVQTFDSGGFTYLELQQDQDRIWLAGPLTPLAVGQTVATTEGVEMAAFYSRTLDRTFDRIWFVAGLRVMGVAPVDRVDRVAAEASGALTVEAAYARVAELAGTSVVVSGRVTRSTEQVLGRNWLHLQDGTGGASTYDLAVTTADSAPVGASVVVRGRLAADRDFGSGYRYAVLIEDATIEAVTP